jgi:hypothetical protein
MFLSVTELLLQTLEIAYTLPLNPEKALEAGVQARLT